jgi:uncharacterized membrane protein
MVKDRIYNVMMGGLLGAVIAVLLGFGFERTPIFILMGMVLGFFTKASKL